MSGGFVSFHNMTPVESAKIPTVDFDAWKKWIIDGCTAAKGRVIALFPLKTGKGVRLIAVLGFDSRSELQTASTELQPEKLRYPSLTPELPQVHGFEREIFEEAGIFPEGHPWLKPIRRLENYPFYRIEGDEVHEVGVGPVHAGIIEPGHFRFQCHGEKILHLEIQLGYQHRGVEKRMLSAKPSLRAVLAESIAGDTVIGHSTAYAGALEALAGCKVPVWASGLRAVALEIERLANHAGDLGALANDVGYLPASSWFGRLRGEFLNLLMELSGNRYGRSLIRPGGVLFGLTAETERDFKRRLKKADEEMKEVSDLLFGTAGVRARFEHTGIVPPEAASALGLVGPVARASDLIRDVRHDYPTGAYQSCFLLPVRFSSGDVYARARVRELETRRSFGLIEELMGLSPASRLSLTDRPGPPDRPGPGDKICAPCEELKASSLVVSMVEGWRGEIVHMVGTDEKGGLDFYKIIDPSFRNWTALALAMRDGEISDFPLCNKSFNLSYCGHDL